MNNSGRPLYTDAQYHMWLEELRPFLECGKSLYKSIELAGLLSKKDSIYRRYKLKDWFCEKIDAFHSVLGEMINDTFCSLIFKIHDKVKRGEDLTHEEIRILMFAAEKHRSAQQFFVNRFETARGRLVEEVIDNLERDDENIDDVVENIQKLVEKKNQPISEIVISGVN